MDAMASAATPEQSQGGKLTRMDEDRACPVRRRSEVLLRVGKLDCTYQVYVYLGMAKWSNA
jgi:hypothetical protein